MAEWKIWDLQALTFSDERAELKYLRTNPEVGRVEVDVGQVQELAVEEHAAQANFPCPITLLYLAELPLGASVVARLIDSFGAERSRATAVVTQGIWRAPIPVAPPVGKSAEPVPAPKKKPIAAQKTKSSPAKKPVARLAKSGSKSAASKTVKKKAAPIAKQGAKAKSVPKKVAPKSKSAPAKKVAKATPARKKSVPAKPVKKTPVAKQGKPRSKKK